MSDRAGGPSTSRRRFLEAAAIFGAYHMAGAPLAAPGKKAAIPPRIAALRLRTTTPLAELEEFYRGSLGLPLVSKGEGELTIGGGGTPITFVRAESEKAPFYHFAFNIPQNKIRGARDWQVERTTLDPIGDHLRDEGYPDDVVFFRNWNAHSIFFWDPAGNLLEYIARHDLDNGAEGAFTSRDILYASEIAFIVDDVPKTAGRLRESLKIGEYRPGSDAFATLGDEHGLLLVFKRGRPWGLDPDYRKEADVFPTVAWVRGASPGVHAVDGYPHEIRVED